MSINQITSPNTYLPSVSFNTASSITQNATNLNVSGLTKISNGTLASPSLAFTFANDTGIYRPAVKTLGLVADSSERVRLEGTVRTSIIMPLRVGNTITGATDYIDFTNVGGDTQLRVIGNSASYINFENPNSDVDLSLGIDNSQNAFLKSKTAYSFQNNTGVQSVLISNNVNGGITLNNSTASYVATALNYYEEYNAPTLIVTGGTAPLNLDGVKIVRCGKLITVFIPQILVTGNGAPLSLNGAIPDRFKPSSNVNFYGTVFDDISIPVIPNQTNGQIDLDTSTGNLLIYRTPNRASFNLGSTAGLRNCTISYIV